MLSEIKNRGAADVCMLVCDGLKGLPDAVAQLWPQTIVQTCIVHLLRNSFRYASKRDWAQLAEDLKPVYTAPSEQAALDRFAASRAIHVTSLFDEDSACVVAELIEEVVARSPHVIVSLDPGSLWCQIWPDAMTRIMKQSSVLFLSGRELQTMATRLAAAMPGAVDETTTVTAIRARLRQPDGAVVVVKHVGQTVVYDQAGRTLVAGPPTDNVEVDDDTGAGDVFAAGYLATRIAPAVNVQLGAQLGMQMAAAKVSSPDMPLRHVRVDELTLDIAPLGRT